MSARILICAVAVLAADVHGQAWLHSPRVYDGLNGVFCAAGNVDGDADQDLIVRATSGPSGFLTMLNDGSGQLTAGGFTPASTSSAVLLLRDVTGDSVLDLVFPAGTTIQILPGNGAGAFGAPVPIAMPGYITALAPGDADGDGPDDLAAGYFDLNSDGHVAWAVSNGGTWTVNAGPSLGQYANPEWLALVDLGSDGDDDIASITYIAGPTATVTITETVAGAPTGSGPSFLVPSFFGPQLGAGDIDVDGDLDLVASSGDGATITIVAVTNAGGTFTAGAPQTYPNFNLGTAFVGDWNGDGAADLLMRGIAFSGAPYVMFSNDGTGAFTLRFTRNLNVPGDGGAGFAHLNGDGHLDFAGASEIWFGDSTFENPLGRPGPNLSWELDWEGDGDVDWFEDVTNLRVNDGRGVFTTTTVPWPTPPPGKTYGVANALGDFDGDGFRDYLTAFSQLNPPFYPTFIEMRLMHGNGDSTTTDVGPAAAPLVPVVGRFASDVDVDGDLDVVGPLGICWNDGSGFFSTTTNPYPGWFPHEMRDFDQDGDEDFLALVDYTIYPFGTFGYAVLRRTGPGTIAVEVLLAPTSSHGLAGVPQFTDVDGDGDLDLAIDSASTGNSVKVHFNTAGVLSAASSIVVPGPHGNTGAAATDVDGDGLVDLVLAGTNRVHVHRRTGMALSYEPPRTWTGFQGGLRLADLDDDGDQDILTGAMITNRRFHGPTAGFARQYGLGSPGAGGFRPVLHLLGPVRVGTIEHLNVSRGIGGGSALLVAGIAEANIPNFGFPGLTAWIQGIFTFIPCTLGGPVGQPGMGAASFGIGPLPPEVSGLRAFLQLAIADPTTPHGLSVTNGVEVLHGY